MAGRGWWQKNYGWSLDLVMPILTHVRGELKLDDKFKC